MIQFIDFDQTDWPSIWTALHGQLDAVDRDPARQFEPLQNHALRVKIVKGKNFGLNTEYKFIERIGEEPEEIYLRYYLRLGDDWNQTVDGGKLPGIAGTYNKAGWGSRRSDGTDGWSARGLFGKTLPAGNPLAGRTPIGSYVYHTDQADFTGDSWIWTHDRRGLLEKNRWYSIEQHVKLNTPGQADGIIRGWVDGQLAFERTNIRFRLVDSLKIEKIWMNVWHGGLSPSPYDQHLYIDNVVIARRYIGPMSPTEP